MSSQSASNTEIVAESDSQEIHAQTNDEAQQSGDAPAADPLAEYEQHFQHIDDSMDQLLQDFANAFSQELNQLVERIRALRTNQNDDGRQKMAQLRSLFAANETVRNELYIVRKVADQFNREVNGVAPEEGTE